MTPTPEQVAQWAREAGGGECFATRPTRVVAWRFDPEELHRLVTLAMAEQAEADAKLCGQVGARQTEFEASDCAATIRDNAPKVTA